MPVTLPRPDGSKAGARVGPARNLAAAEVAGRPQPRMLPVFAAPPAGRAAALRVRAGYFDDGGSEISSVPWAMQASLPSLLTSQRTTAERRPSATTVASAESTPLFTARR